MSSYAPYDPLNVLKPVGERVWIVDGPEIKMAYPYLRLLKLAFPTRMTVARLADGGLWIHSPTPLTDALARDIDALGAVRFLVAPNRLHYWWIGDWKARYPHAVTYAAPGVRAAAARRFAGFEVELTDTPPPQWQGEIEQTLVRGDFMTEAVFMHVASRTLILTDLIENFEPRRIAGRLMRSIVCLAGCCDPDGAMPVDLRATFYRHRAGFGAAIERMLSWGPERIVLAHGRWYPANADAELKRAFRWVYRAAA
ncbi:MAG: DUF4336 domain-containing protein [Proteobacteria bacterium]|nr:DUF4336 domain-containing protein [Pseudomonadota bacterium]